MVSVALDNLAAGHSIPEIVQFYPRVEAAIRRVVALSSQGRLSGAL